MLINSSISWGSLKIWHCPTRILTNFWFVARRWFVARSCVQFFCGQVAACWWIFGHANLHNHNSAFPSFVFPANLNNHDQPCQLCFIRKSRCPLAVGIVITLLPQSYCCWFATASPHLRGLQARWSVKSWSELMSGSWVSAVPLKCLN